MSEQETKKRSLRERFADWLESLEPRRYWLHRFYISLIFISLLLVVVGVVLAVIALFVVACSKGLWFIAIPMMMVSAAAFIATFLAPTF